MDTLPPHVQDDNTIPQKRCTGACGRMLPATPEFFHRCGANKDGLKNQCRECIKSHSKAYYVEHRESILEYHKERNTQPDVQEQRKAYNKAYFSKPDVRERHRERQANLYRNSAEYREKHRIYYQHYYARADIKARIQAHHKAYYARPDIQERERAYDKAYSSRPGFKDRYSSYMRIYNRRSEVIERRRRYSINRYHNHPGVKERHRIYRLNRIARKKSAYGTHTSAQIIEQYQRQKGHCYYCKHKVIWGKHHVDHVIPLSRGGSNDISNLVIACRTCNLRKNNRLPHEWPEGGRLF